jgi:hypothetical protein
MSCRCKKKRLHLDAKPITSPSENKKQYKKIIIDTFIKTLLFFAGCVPDNIKEKQHQ